MKKLDQRGISNIHRSPDLSQAYTFMVLSEHSTIELQTQLYGAKCQHPQDHILSKKKYGKRAGASDVTRSPAKKKKTQAHSCSQGDASIVRSRPSRPPQTAVRRQRAARPRAHASCNSPPPGAGPPPLVDRAGNPRQPARAGVARSAPDRRCAAPPAARATAEAPRAAAASAVPAPAAGSPPRWRAAPPPERRQRRAATARWAAAAATPTPPPAGAVCRRGRDARRAAAAAAGRGAAAPRPRRSGRPAAAHPPPDGMDL